jgi:hypothetical protein
MEVWIKWNARTARRARAAPDSHRLFRISLQREFSGWIEAAEQIHQFTLDDRDRSPIAIQGVADREVEAEWPARWPSRRRQTCQNLLPSRAASSRRCGHAHRSQGHVCPIDRKGFLQAARSRLRIWASSAFLHSCIEINKRADQPGQREGHCLWIIHCL